MMIAIVTLNLLALASAAPVSQNEIEVKSYKNNIGLGDYNFSYELSDGTSRSEERELRDAGTDREALSVRGSYSREAPDGTVWSVSYMADDQGFRVLDDYVDDIRIPVIYSTAESLLG